MVVAYHHSIFLINFYCKNSIFFFEKFLSNLQYSNGIIFVRANKFSSHKCATSVSSARECICEMIALKRRTDHQAVSYARGGIKKLLFLLTTCTYFLY